MRELRLTDNAERWYSVIGEETRPLDSLPLILMRKDPPFDTEYIYGTYLLEEAERAGSLVINRPSSLRDANEKVFAVRFPQCCPPTLITRRLVDIEHFLNQHGDIILKPLGGMGGQSVYRVRAGDPNFYVIVEDLTAKGSRYCMGQRFLPEIAHGDKRILMIDGKPVPYALARIPRAGETRGNIAAGGRTEGRPLTDGDRWIASEVGPELVRRGILFAGLDVIGDQLTEINVTSPTCIRELDEEHGLDIAGDLLNVLEDRLGAR
jgi:glutathione synthase